MIALHFSASWVMVASSESISVISFNLLQGVSHKPSSWEGIMWLASGQL